MKKKLLMFVLLLLSVFVFSCGKKEEERNYIIMGTSTIFPPFIYSTSSEQFVGFDIELGKIIARNYGKGIQITNMNFSELLPAVQNGTIDMAICATTITDERRRIVDFSAPYYQTSETVIIRKDHIGDFANITTKEELGQNIELASETGTTCAITARTLAGGRYVLEDTYDVIIEALKNDRIEAIIMDGDIAQMTIINNEDFTTLPIKFTEDLYGVAVQKGNDRLLSSINKTLADLQSSGEYQRLVEKHINAYLNK